MRGKNVKEKNKIENTYFCYYLPAYLQTQNMSACVYIHIHVKSVVIFTLRSFRFIRILQANGQQKLCVLYIYIILSYFINYKFKKWRIKCDVILWIHYIT